MLPLDHSGRPLYPGQGGALFHPKVGILTNGDVIGFNGSVNETSADWTRKDATEADHEKFAD